MSDKDHIEDESLSDRVRHLEIQFRGLEVKVDRIEEDSKNLRSDIKELDRKVDILSARLYWIMGIGIAAIVVIEVGVLATSNFLGK